MNAKFKQILSFSVVLAMLFSSAPAYAWSSCDKDGDDPAKIEERMEKKMEKLVEELGLTPEQEEAIRNAKTGQKEAKKELREKIKAKRKELKEELEKENTDKAKVDPIVVELKELTGQKLDQMVTGVLSIKEVLTPEQYKKFKDNVKGYKGKEWGKHKGMKKMHKKGFRHEKGE